MRSYFITSVTPILNTKSNSEVPGRFRIMAQPEGPSGGEVEAIQTYDAVGKLDSGIKLIPEKGDRFLGEFVNESLYIIKFLDSVTSDSAENGYVPKWYNLMKPGIGDYTIKGQAFNFISLLRDGLIRLFAGPGVNIELDPWVPNPKHNPDVEKDLIYTKDRIIAKCKNYILKTFGGLMKWSNFKEDNTWKSEFEIKAKHGDPLSSKNNVRVRMGSQTDSKKNIFRFQVNYDKDTHDMSIDNEKVSVISKIADNTTTTVVNKDGVSITTNKDYTINAKGNTVVLNDSGITFTDKYGHKFEIGQKGTKIDGNYIALEGIVKFIDNNKDKLGLGNMGKPVPLFPTTMTTFVKDNATKNTYLSDQAAK